MYNVLMYASVILSGSEDTSLERTVMPRVPQFPNYFTHTNPIRIKWSSGLLARLPESYKRFYEEWQYGVRTPVHWIPHKKEYERLPTGEL